jgi:hypothetical protein
VYRAGSSVWTGAVRFWLQGGNHSLEGVCRVVPGFWLEANRQALFVCPANLGTKQDGMQKQDGVQFPAARLQSTWQPLEARHYRRRNKKGANGDLCPGMPFKGGCLGQNENERRPIPTTTEGTGQRSKASSGKPHKCTEQVGFPLPKK